MPTDPLCGKGHEVGDVLGDERSVLGGGKGEECFISHTTQVGMGSDRNDIEGFARELDSNTWSVHLVEEEFHRSSSSRWRRHDASASSARRARSASNSSISSV